jgi:hypothetical protein
MNNFKAINRLIKKRLALERKIQAIHAEIERNGEGFEKLGDGIYRLSYDKSTGIEKRVVCYPIVRTIEVKHKPR